MTSIMDFQFREKTARPLECVVCGLPSSGCHYDIAACKGCKSFFRRMCLSTDRYSCVANNRNYNFERATNPKFHCRSCRFKKCLLVGMNPKALIFKKEHSIFHLNILRTEEEYIEETMEMLVYLDHSMEKFRLCAYNSSWAETGNLSDMATCSSKLNLADQYGIFPGYAESAEYVFAPHNCYKYLKPLHRKKKYWKFFNLITSIEFIKAFPFFHQLDLNDKKVLLKHGIIGCANLNVSYFTLKNKFEDIRQPDGTQRPRKDSSHYYAFAMAIGPLRRVQIQYIEYLLLKMLFICNPAIPNLSFHGQNVLERYQRQYSKILLDQCFRKIGGSTRFAELIGILGVLARQQKILRDLHAYQLTMVLGKLPEKFCLSLVHDLVFE